MCVCHTLSQSLSQPHTIISAVLVLYLCSTIRGSRDSLSQSLPPLSLSVWVCVCLSHYVTVSLPAMHHYISHSCPVFTFHGMGCRFSRFPVSVSPPLSPPSLSLCLCGCVCVSVTHCHSLSQPHTSRSCPVFTFHRMGCRFSRFPLYPPPLSVCLCRCVCVCHTLSQSLPQPHTIISAVLVLYLRSPVQALGSQDSVSRQTLTM